MYMTVRLFLEVNPGPLFMKCSLLNAHNFQKHGWNKVLAKEDLFFACILNAYISYVLNKFWKSVNYYLCCILLSLVCCLFGVFVSLENFSLIWRRHYYRWRTAKFDLCSARMAIEQWGFFSVPHLLWQEAYVYNGHLHGPVTLKPDAERLAVDLSLPDFTT